jgi:hypothetical protein
MAEVDILARGLRWVDAAEYWDRWSHWRWLQTPIVGAAVSDAGGVIMGVDWPHVWPMIGLAIAAIGPAILGVFRYQRLANIEVRMKEDEAAILKAERIEASRRRLQGWTPPPDLITRTVQDPPG